jgi:hypothetical protein
VWVGMLSATLAERSVAGILGHGTADSPQRFGRPLERSTFEPNNITVHRRKVHKNRYINHLPMQKVISRPRPLFRLVSECSAVPGDSKLRRSSPRASDAHGPIGPTQKSESGRCRVFDQRSKSDAATIRRASFSPGLRSSAYLAASQYPFGIHPSHKRFYLNLPRQSSISR